MKQRIFLLFTLLVSAWLSASAFYDFMVDGIAYLKNSDGMSVTVTSGGSKQSGSLTIPEKVSYDGKDYSVTSIGSFAFRNRSGFTGSLTIPNSVTTIGEYAFYLCSGFTGSLTIPNSVTSIGKGAFSSCSGFTGSLTIPNTVTTIGDWAFSSCSGFTGSLTIPNTVTTIGDWAFCYCSSFTGLLTIGNSVTSIGEYAFYLCSGFTGSLTIPNSVTSIGRSAFHNCSGFTGSLNIPNSVTSIGKGAFSSCSGFTGSLTIPNSVTSIEESAFSSCSGFTGSLNIPSSVTYIGNSAFYGCSGFTGSLTIPNSVTSIGKGAFSSCSGFTGSLTIPNSVTSIEESAFSSCSGFTGSLNIPSSVTYIGNSAFYGCSGFTGSLTIPNSVTSIGESAFYDCGGLTGSLTIPNSVTSIGSSAFSYCSGFTGSLIIPNSVTSIGESAFTHCSGFTGSLTIGNSVTEIGWYAFRNCSGFTGSLTIGNSVEYIKGSAFENCLRFVDIKSFNPQPPKVVNSSFANVPKTIPLYVPAKSVDAYKTASIWKEFINIKAATSITLNQNTLSLRDGESYNLVATVVLDGVVSNNVTWKSSNTAIATVDANGKITGLNPGTVTITATADGTNLSASCLVTVTEPVEFEYKGLMYHKNDDHKTAYVTYQEIDNENNYKDVVSVNIPETVTDKYRTYTVIGIGDDAFNNCVTLTSVKYASTISSIGDNAFFNCKKLTGFTFSNNITTIGSRAFGNCLSLKQIIIPETVTSIGTRAFSGCGKLSSVKVASGNTVYDSREDCNAIIESATNTLVAGCINTVIPNSVTKIGDYAFDEIFDLTDISIPNSVTEIGDYAFRYCSELLSVTIGNSVKTIGNYAFYDCSDLEDVVIGTSVTSIGSYAFAKCRALSHITIPGAVTSIGKYAFSECDDLVEIYSLNPQPPAVDNPFSNNTYNKATLYVHDSNINGYATANYWKNFRYIKGCNQIYTTEQEFFGGETILVPVYMKNPIEVTGFQTDIILPEGLDFAVDEDGYPEIYLSDRKNRSHTLGTTAIGEKCQRLLSYSSTSKPYSGEDGELFFFKVKSSWNTPIGDNIITLTNSELALPDGTKSKKLDNKIILHCYYVPGDANHDKKVSISDIIADARYILLQNPDPFHYKSANLNEDYEISVSDIVLTANVILGRHQVPDKKYSVQRMMGNDILDASVLETRSDGSRTIAIALDNSNDYTAFQADLCLPEGMEVTGARLSDRAGRSHTVAMNQIGGNTVRVLSYASDNAVFTGNSGDLLLIDVKGRGNIEMTNALFAEPNGCEHEFDEMSFSTELSGINDITVGNAPVNVYNTAGQLIRTNVNPETATQGLPAGFYLVGNKKVVVK